MMGAAKRKSRIKNLASTTLISESSKDSIRSNEAMRKDRSAMEAAIKTELYGAVFQYDGFWDDFLVDNPSAEASVRSRIASMKKDQDLQLKGSLKASKLHYDTRAQLWRFDAKPYLDKKGREIETYESLVKLLNPLGRAAFAENNDPVFRPTYEPFFDQHRKPAYSDYPSDTSTKPDIVKGARTTKDGPAHWGDVELVIECKAEDKGWSAAYVQLARYARAVFSNQIYRHYFYAVAACWPCVTFVRFNRSGLLHSQKIHLGLPEGQDQFVRKMIALLSLKPDDFGYDVRYSFIPDESEEKLLTVFTPEGQRQRMVGLVLCHRKCCVGRATVAACLEPMPNNGPKQAADEDQFLNQVIVHKSIWRDSRRADEAQTLRLFEGVYGVCQLVSSQTDVRTTEVKYPTRMTRPHGVSQFKPTLPSRSDGQSQATQTTQSAFQVSVSGVHQNTEAGSEARGDQVQSIQRPIRVLSSIVMPKGGSIFQVTDSIKILDIIHDAALGIAAFNELGMVHCDMSAHNILVIEKDHYQLAGGWKQKPKGSLGPAVWDCKALEPLPAEQPGEVDWSAANDYDSPMHTYVKNMDRGPCAVLMDVEFSVKARRELEDVHVDRTGTPAFISAQLLVDPPDRQKPVLRKYIHDLESLLWVLIYRAAHGDPKNMNRKAKDYLAQLSNPDLEQLGEFKKNQLLAPASFHPRILAFNNPLAKELARTISYLAFLFEALLYPNEELSDDEDNDQRLFSRKHHEYSRLSRWQVFKEFLDILNKQKARIQQKRNDSNRAGGN